MSNKVIMPKMGESIVEGTIIEWKKSIGDFVSKDEILLEISTDKVDSEIPSPFEGTLTKILFKMIANLAVLELFLYVFLSILLVDSFNITNINVLAILIRMNYLIQI